MNQDEADRRVLNESPPEDFAEQSAPAFASLSSGMVRRRRQGARAETVAPTIPTPRSATPKPPQPAAAAAPKTMVPPPPDARPQPPAQPQPERPDLRTYWDDLRQGKRFPAARDLDGEQIARASRNAVLMRLRPDGRRLEVRNRFASALVSSSTDGIEESEDVAAPMIEWCLLVAGRAAREGRAMTAFEDFASRQGNVRYRAVALPLADDREHVDHVLCEICRER